MRSRRILSQSQNLRLSSVSHLLRPCQWRGGFLPPFLTCKLTRFCPGPWEERILTPAEAVACPGPPCVSGWGTDVGYWTSRGGGRLLEGPAALTLLPPSRQECLARLLSPCGPVQSVELQGKPELTESPKEPKSKFFHPKPVAVSLHSWGLPA